MASNVISVNDQVRIDGHGLGIVTEIVYRGFTTSYMVRLVDSNFEVELERERLTIVPTDEMNAMSERPRSRFNIVSDSDVDAFNHEQSSSKKFFEEPEINENREIFEIPENELSSLLCRFLVSVRKQNGDEYEPSVLRGMISSFDRQLRRKGYEQTIALGPGFAKVRETLSMKQRQLKKDGRGNLPKKSEPLSDKDIDHLWNSDQLGTRTPDTILQTLWLYNTIHFGLRSCQEHRDMCWGDISLMADDNGHEYLQFSERQTKTRSGENPRDVRVIKPKMWANVVNHDRCPIAVYKLYAEKRPMNYSEFDHPFYIATTTIHLPSPRDTWFKRNPVGINKLGSMMKRMVQHSGLNSSKRLTNHSARKYLVQKLNDSNIPPNQIMQISGHKNIASINNYSHINQNQHRQISDILHSNVKENNPANPIPYPCSNSAQLNHNTAHVNTDSRSNLHVSGGFQSIFSAPIHGGTFHVHVHQNDSKLNQNSGHKRARYIDSDSD
ncbi:uncharacterized protein KIAA1958-like [Ruditapes philippinarum]|uniref:uncharacterized protein KIAA1958-like n=1 Tax=Ruditapes philippinarum TaxID=129788 RepID=UPI00295B8A12|nr:uncharacterized protein KIAA1958-like [Ruditapes philippinarum]